MVMIIKENKYRKKKEMNERKKRKEIKLEVTYVRTILFYVNPIKSVLLNKNRYIR